MTRSVTMAVAWAGLLAAARCQVSDDTAEANSRVEARRRAAFEARACGVFRPPDLAGTAQWEHDSALLRIATKSPVRAFSIAREKAKAATGPMQHQALYASGRDLYLQHQSPLHDLIGLAILRSAASSLGNRHAVEAIGFAMVRYRRCLGKLNITDTGAKLLEAKRRRRAGQDTYH